MSPQFRTRSSTLDNTPFSNTDDDPSVATIALGKQNLGNTDPKNNASPANPPVYQASDEAAASPLKRLFSNISPFTDCQPLLSLHGPAVSFGVRGGIANASNDLLQLDPPVDGVGVANTTDGCGEPCTKKTKSSRQSKSYVALVDLAEEVISEAAPSGAPFHLNASTQTMQLFHDPVRELQDMAFPSLPRLPTTVSSCSFHDTSIPTLPPSWAVDVDSQDSHSYGWFIFTDVDEGDTPDRGEPTVAGMFLPDSKPELAFKMATAPSAENQELVVQQALAADTIDDVLGDLF